jgi:hypothetical protein
MRGALIMGIAFLVLPTSCAPPLSGRSTDDGVDEFRSDLAAFGAKNQVDVGTLSAENARFLISFYCARGSLLSAAGFYNLGNAFFLDEKLPEAIFAFQRGLRLDPNDAELRANLDYARARVQYPFGERGQPESPSWLPWLYRPSPFQVLLMALVFYAVTCLLAMRWFMTRRRLLLIRAGVVLFLAMAGAIFSLYLEQENAWQGQHPLVVIRDDKLALRRGNGPSYPANPDLPFLSRGMEARRIHERGAWLQIQFASGELGWVEKAAVLVADPCP